MTDVSVNITFAGDWLDAETDYTPEQQEAFVKEALREEFSFDVERWCRVEVYHD